MDTKSVQLTATPHEDQDFEAFIVSPYVMETLNIGSDINGVKFMKDAYTHPGVLARVRYSQGDIGVIIGQDFCRAIHPLEYFEANKKRSTVVVRLPIGWALSGSLPPSVSRCFKDNTEQDYELACQAKSCCISPS